MVDNLDEVNYFIKELLRIDSPSFSNFNQNVRENVTIDGIDLLKGTDI